MQKMLLVYMCKFVSKDITLLLSGIKFENTRELLNQFKKSIEFENEMLQYVVGSANDPQHTVQPINLGIVDAFNSVIFLIISKQDEQLTKFIVSLPKKIKSSSTSHLITRSEGIYLASVDDFWELAGCLMEDIRIVTNQLPLKRLIEAIDNALIEYYNYLVSTLLNPTKLVNTGGGKGEKIQICIYILNSCVKMLILRKERIPSIATPDLLELTFIKAVKQTCSKLISQHREHNNLLNLTYLKESIFDRLLKPKNQEGFDEQQLVREELSETLIRYVTTNLQKEIMSKKWSTEKASQKRMEVTSLVTNIKQILPLTMRTVLDHAISPLDNLLLVLMTPVSIEASPQAGLREEGREGDLATLINIYLCKVSTVGSVDEFVKYLTLREDFNKKAFVAEFLKKVPPKPSQLK